MSTELPVAVREKIENTIRNLAIDAVERAGCGHPGAPMGLARPAFEIWANHLRFDPQDPEWPLRDRFVLSAGHASMLLYSLLHLFGFDLSMDDLKNFRQMGSKTPGHPEYGQTPGVEVTTGPLGQGFGHGVGMALAGRLARAHFGRDGVGPGYHRVFGIVSDGDLMEGVSYEASSLAGHHGLGNLIYLYDDNGITIDGPAKLSFSEDVANRFVSQGWHVESVSGEDVAAIREALNRAVGEENQPSLIITKTTIGYGSPNRAGKSKSHGEKLGKEEVQLTKKALGWPPEPTFLVPDEVKDCMAGLNAGKVAGRQAEDERFDKWRVAHEPLAKSWEAARKKEVPENLGELLSEGLSGIDDATRKHSGAVIQKLFEHVPFLVGGSADLAGSNNTRIAAAQDVDPSSSETFNGHNLHFGVREHAMGAVLNGIGLDGTFVGYGGTFLVFSDYVRPSIRLAALMKIPTIFVFTHDSIFLGEDGPTHQPIEHLDTLRAIPGLTLFRPADGVETAMAWSWAVTEAKGPVVMALTRQKVSAPTRPTTFRNASVLRGAYNLSDESVVPDVVLMASGSEVPTIVGAAEILADTGVKARVVSAPCLDLFQEQEESYQMSLVPEGIPVVAVEAGLGHSFLPWAGRDGLILGINTFGESAPYSDLAETFGFTPALVAERVRKHLQL